MNYGKSSIINKTNLYKNCRNLHHRRIFHRFPHSHILSSTEIWKHLPLLSPRDARLEGVRSFLPEPAVLIAHGGNISTCSTGGDGCGLPSGELT